MKAIRQMVLAVALVLTALGCRADYLPFLEEGKWWIVEEVCRTYNGYEEEVFAHWKVSVTGKVKIGEHEYFTLRSSRADRNKDGKWVEHSMLLPAVEFMLYEKNGTVYTVNPGDEKGFKLEVLFTLDEYPSYMDYVRPTTIEIEGESRSAVYIKEIYSGLRVWIVEGIGANYDYWVSRMHEISDSAQVYKAYNTRMLECYIGDKLLFTQDDFQNLEVPDLIDGTEI